MLANVAMFAIVAIFAIIAIFSNIAMFVTMAMPAAIAKLPTPAMFATLATLVAINNIWSHGNTCNFAMVGNKIIVIIAKMATTTIQYIAVIIIIGNYIFHRKTNAISCQL